MLSDVSRRLSCKSTLRSDIVLFTADCAVRRQFADKDAPQLDDRRVSASLSLFLCGSDEYVHSISRQKLKS